MPIADAPLSNKQHAVPQNIMDVEFKLVGDLTMRQFSYLMLFGILSYLSFTVVIGIFKIPLGVTFAALGLALAFVPLGERGLDDWIVSFIRAINSPTQRVWKKEPEIPFAFSYRSLDVVKQELITLAPTSSRRKLEEYLKYKLDEEVKDPLDIPEQAYIMKVREAFSYNTPGASSYTNQPPVSVGVSVIEEPAPSLPPESPDQVSDISEKKEEDHRDTQSVSPEISDKALPIRKGFGQESRPKPPIRLLQTEELGSNNEESLGIEMLTITPDRHSGRKFINLLPSVGELILPIRGERMLRTSDQVKVEDEIKEKTSRLQTLLSRIREKENIPGSVSTAVQDTPKPVVEVAKEAEDVVKNLQDRNERLSVDIETLRKSIQHDKVMSLETSSQEQRLQNLIDEKEKIASSYTELGKKYEELQQELEGKRSTAIDTEAQQFSQRTPVINPAVNLNPNILSGVVKDSGGKLLPNILIIVKNRKGESVRAFKTNPMGQFTLLTPLDNGIYTVEVSSTNNLSETFAIIPVEVKGDVIPSMEFIGKN